MKYTLLELQQALSVMEHFGLLGQIKGKPAQAKADIIERLNGETPGEFVKRKRTKMTPEMIDEIWNLHKNTWRQTDIAKKVGVHVSTVGRVLRNETV